MAMELDLGDHGGLIEAVRREVLRAGFHGSIARLSDAPTTTKLAYRCRRCEEPLEVSVDSYDLLEAATSKLYEFVDVVRHHKAVHDAVDGSITRDQLQRELTRAFLATKPQHEAEALVRAFEKLTDPRAVTEAWGLLSNVPTLKQNEVWTKANQEAWITGRSRWIASWAPKKPDRTPATLDSVTAVTLSEASVRDTARRMYLDMGFTRHAAETMADQVVERWRGV